MAWRQILQVIGLFIVFNIGYYVVFTFLPAYFIKALGFTTTDAFVSITLAATVALELTLRETAGRALARVQQPRATLGAGIEEGETRR